MRFKVDNAQAKFILALENNDTTYRRFAVYGHDGNLNVQYNDGYSSTAWREPTTLIPTPALQANVWYTLTLVVDDLRGLTLQVCPVNDPSGCSGYNIFIVAGKSWRFHAWTWTNAAQGSLYLDDYREFSGGAVFAPDELMRFQYDALDRLTSAAQDPAMQGYNESYQYNPIGNITYTSRLGTYVYPAPGLGSVRPHAATAAGGNAYEYDANGNTPSTCAERSAGASVTLRVEVSGTQVMTYRQQFDVDAGAPPERGDEHCHRRGSSVLLQWRWAACEKGGNGWRGRHDDGVRGRAL